MEFEKIFIRFIEELYENRKLSFGESDVQLNDAHTVDLTDSLRRRISEQILLFYQEITLQKVDWTNRGNAGVRGFINILPIEVATGSWEGSLYFKGKSPEGMKNFKAFDFFLPECCVGFYLADENENPNEELYAYDLEDEPEPLNVNMEGYIQLLYMARGFSYWPYVLRGLEGGRDYGVTEKFKNGMPQVFPDFKWEDFVALYEKVKLRK